MIFSDKKTTWGLTTSQTVNDFRTFIVYERIKAGYGYPIPTILLSSKQMKIFTTFDGRLKGRNCNTRINLYDLMRNSSLITKIPYYQKNTTLIKQAVSECTGVAMEFLPEEMKTQEIISIALKSNPEAIKFIPEHLITPGVIRIVLTLRNSLVISFPDDEVVNKNLENWESGVAYIPKSWDRWNI